jgi:SNF2 family DNA or RNA helicase
MRILHGTWLNGDYLAKDKGFVLWAESSETRVSQARLRRGVRPHPYALSCKALRTLLLDLLTSAKVLMRSTTKDSKIVARLPSTPDRPMPSSPFLFEEETKREKLTFSAWKIEAIGVAPQDVLELLANLPSEEETTPGVKIGSDLRYWQHAGQLAQELLAQQRFAPVLLEEGVRYLGVWQPQWNNADLARLDRLTQVLPSICRAVGRDERAAILNPRALLTNFLTITVDAFAREHADFGKAIVASKDMPVAEAWLVALRSADPVVPASFPTLVQYHDQYRAWTETFPGAIGGDTFRLCFRLDPPEMDGEPDAIFAPKLNRRDWSLRFFLQATDDLSLLVPAEAAWRERGSTLKYLNRKFDTPQERMLAGLGLASRIFPPLEASLKSARPTECALNVEQAYTFMRETALLLESSGFGVLVPNVTGKLGVRVTVKSKEAPKGGLSLLTAESIFEYDWQLALGDEPLAEDEFNRLASLKVPLVQVRGQWVELRPDQIKQAIEYWEKRKAAEEVPLAEALRMSLAGETASSAGGLPINAVAVEGWLNDLLRQLAGGAKMQPVPTPSRFHGELRHYQSTGLAWLAFLRQWGLGACLADDMGLGKTIQVIALLLHERLGQAQPKPALLICPTSVVGNWQRELQRFAPDLRVLIHHGAARHKDTLSRQAGQHDVVISSYALLHRDEQLLTGIEWSDVILDEAQNIKNPSTKQAQTARRLQAQWRAALTGTPVENRLTELWSIFQFLNPGYLGSQQDFLDRLARPIEQRADESATQQLKSLVGPFILRRLKTDPAVITDLPAKNEMKVYCSLTKEQATLYQAVVRDSLQKIQGTEGIDRRGVILATLLKLKQVCNHPAQFLGDGSALPGRSGKLARLGEMLEEARAVRDRVLIFTQFAEMGHLLRNYLQDTFGDEVFFLHGGTPAKTRTKMVQAFQDDPHGPLIFILSIKAGGTGVNLTRANHVFHFDRWWNPAVENQATDRAFRIGQTRNVQVHKFLCAGTFEEKIDEMIERKQALAAAIVGESEGWLTELSTEQLKDLFSLRKEAVGD